jgi:uncharacterized Zn finger protein
MRRVGSDNFRRAEWEKLLLRDDKVSLTEEQISRLADGSSFGRGIDYYESGNICNPVQLGRELRGECYGSRRQPYKIRVVLRDGGMDDATIGYGVCPRRKILTPRWLRLPGAFF